MADTPDLGSGPVRGGGSSPLSRTNFTEENEKNGFSRTDSAQNQNHLGNAHVGRLKFPIKIKFRKAVATIYGKSPSYPFYRVCYHAAGRRHLRSFASYQEAKAEAESKVREISSGNQTLALTNAEAVAALSIREALEAFRRETGRNFTPVEAVSGFLDAMRQLPPGLGLTESVREFAQTRATIKPMLITKAVEEFLAIRRPKSIAPEGKRAQLSASYAQHVECWLREFAETFKGHGLAQILA